MWRYGEIVDGTYQIISELGRGGIGVIYLAYHLRLEKYVVIKKIKDNLTDVVNFRTEVDILKELHHPYLPQVYDFVQVGSKVYTVIDYIEGRDLESYLNAGYVFTEQQIVCWLKQLCNVLAYLHSRKPMILHCDIKPANIMIDTAGNVCLIDFNISLGDDSSRELTGISQYYASPEQYRRAMATVTHIKNNDIIDQRTDIYSLGATFYHLLSGICPSVSEPNTPLSQINLDYSPDLLLIIDKMMDRNVNKRFRSAENVITKLDGMYKKNAALKRLIISCIACFLAYVAVLVSGIWMRTYGIKLRNDETFKRSFETLETYYANEDYPEVVDYGVDILNVDTNVTYFKRNQSIKAEILHMVADAYFYSDEYEASVPYYEESYKMSMNTDNNAVYGRDYAIALVRCSNVTRAHEIALDVKNKGLTDFDLLLIDSEICYNEGKYNDVLSCAEGIIKNCNDNELVSRACIVCAMACSELGDERGQIEYYEKSEEVNPSLINKRRIGDAYLRIAEKQGSNFVSQQRNYYKKAEEYYVQIVSGEYSSITDKINLSVIYMSLNEYDEAIRLLRDTLDENPYNYKIQMYLAFSYDKCGNRTEAAYSCNAAISLYEKTPQKNKESSESNNIQNLYLLQEKYK